MKSPERIACIPGMTDYRPVSCSVYDLFEAAALHQRILELTIDGICADYVILDVFSKGKEEFLTVSAPSTSAKSVIRLDKIDLIVDPSDKKSYFPYEC